MLLDAAENEDVDMASQNPDEIPGSDEPNQENDNDEDENQNKDEDVITDNDNSKDQDKEINNQQAEDKDEDKGEEQPAATKTEDDNTAKCVEMEDVSEINNTGTSNGEEMKDSVEPSEEPDLIPPDSIQSKGAGRQFVCAPPGPNAFVNRLYPFQVCSYDPDI
ncbi:hypothetical protein D9C73_019959 [Collichthys lucidus]|uniref:Uncharacterized protein n=1 Tax=Collichthys lucidus TaxID=240159 RepID=A0A4U5VBC7_COLLU|nr:hypothetical protein D9C73_019959 [Collichthys lucidus]